MTRIDHAPPASHPLRRPLVIVLLALAITITVTALPGGMATPGPATAVPDVAAAAASTALSPQEALEVYDVYLDVARYAAAHDLRGLSPVSLERIGGVPPLP